MNVGKHRFASERGAILIYTAVSALVLLGFATFVIDNGVLWVSRVQAQNAADAGALAGAVGRSYSDADAVESAKQVIASNLIWGLPGSSDVFIGNCFPGVSGECVYVSVYRNGEGTPASPRLPTFFGPLLGISDQGVKAFAAAVLTEGNATHCMRPVAIPDKWRESLPPDNVFIKYVEPGTGATVPNPDEYFPPEASDDDPLTSPTGYRFGTDLGVEITLTVTSVASPISFGGSFLPLELTSGVPTYANDVENCNTRLSIIGEQMPISTDPEATDPVTEDRFRVLFDLDPDATWGPGKIENSCAPVCAPVSPRLVPIAVYDVDAFQFKRATGDWGTCAGPCVEVVNILGFFVTDASGPGVRGRLTSYPGLISGVPTINPSMSFLKTVRLLR